MAVLGKQTSASSLLAAGGALAIVYKILQRMWSRPRNVTMLPSWWIIGNVFESLKAIREKKLNQRMLEFHNEYGRTYCMSLSVFMPYTVATTCPKNVEHILKKNFENYPKGAVFRSKLAELLGQGIFNSDGTEWHSQRKVSSHMFTAKLFKEHIWTVVRRNAAKTRAILEGADMDKPVDIFNLMNRFTLDTIGEIGFGKSIDSLGDPSSPFLLSFDRAQQIMQKRFLLPFWQVLRLFGLGFESETAMHMDQLNTFTKSLVRELKGGMQHKAGKAGGVAWDDLEARKSFVGMFLVDAQSRGEELDEEYLRDLVLNFLIAGRDTTAQALSWTIFCLCQHPDVAEKVRQELADVCGIRGPAYEDMSRLPYLQAVLSEALRLYPSVPVDTKVAANNDTWPDGTFVPRGTTVIYDIYCMGRDTKIWGDDAEKFRPERWLDMSEPPSSYEYAVFNAGPRECLGKRLAWVEMKTCLAMLLPNIDFKLAVSATEVIPDTQLTIGMAHGLPCFIEHRGAHKGIGSNASTAASTCSEGATAMLA